MKHLLRNLWIVALIACCNFQQVFAQQLPPIPIDQDVRIGKLDNGLTYYIRKNSLPANRADFYIAQKVGSIQEEDNQRGLAHFLEHMCFNGTTHFPGDALKQYLERIGVKFGENLNAYTSVDETVYNISNVPVNTPGAIDSCLLILHDWSNDLTLDPKEIDKERGVINEEWRTRMSAMQRFQEKMLPVMFAGTKYANCFPIGTMDVVMNFKPQTLRDYYEKWYRPDLQGVIVVGDIDVDAVEAQIKKMFADVPAPVNPAKREQVSVPDNDLPLISIAKDKEASNTILYIFYKHDKLPNDLNRTIAGLVKDYIQQICASIMDERFDDILHQANPPFIYAQAYDDDNFMIAKSKGAWTVAALAKEGEIDSTLTTLVKETQRVKQYGFTPSEYERARINVLKQYESAYNERNNQKNDAYVREYVNHFTNGGYIPGIEMEYTLLNQIAQNIPVEQVNQYIQDMIGEDNIVIGLTGPDKEGIKYPTEENLLRTFLKARQMPVEPYKETVSNEPLVPTLPTPGQITETKTGQPFGATVFTLSNGIKVVLKPTEFKKDEIIMTATSPGGSTLFSTKDIDNLKVFNDVIEIGGLGNFSATDLSKRLAGKKVSCALSLSQDSENVNGMAAPSDLRTLFELIYLSFTAPRMDEEAYASFETRTKAQLQNMELNPMVAFSDSLSKAVYGDNPRASRLRPQDFEHISYPRIMEMRKERFSDASGFVFTFVGNIQIDSIRPYIEQYLATLPSQGKIEKGNPAEVPSMRKGDYMNRFNRSMEIPKVTVANLYTGQMEYNLENIITATALKQVMDLVYYEKVREKEGGTYGVGVSARISPFPEGRTTLQIFFDTDPAKWEQMNTIVRNELKRLSEVGPRQEDFKKTQDNLLKRHAEVLQENSYWLNVLDDYYYKGFDTDTDYESIVKALTPEKIKAFAQKLLGQGNRVEVIMQP